ncbi:MAG: transcriptional repressor LexA [Candidatus Jorgensenbacteria bacterium]
MLTEKKKDVLNFVTRYSRKHGYSPSIPEIAKGIKRAVGTVHEHLQKLENEGYIRLSKNQRRGIEILEAIAMVQIPIRGTISAGQPLTLFEEHTETIAVPAARIPQSGDVYALRVQGESMIEENINDGDIILVKQQAVAENGQKVVALIDNYDTTIKKFYNERGQIRLQPANKTMAPIIIKKGEREFVIQGIALDVIRESTVARERVLPNKPLKVASRRNTAPYFEAKSVSIYRDGLLKITSIPNNSVDLIVTSPPYNVDIHYNSHNDNLTYGEYLEFTHQWIKKCYELAKDDGRFCLNIPLDKNKGGQQSVGADITKIAKEVGWKYHSTIIWNEGNISRRTAWGSFMSASAPYVIAPVELILILYKNSWKKMSGSRENDISRKEFMDWTNGVWTFNGQSKKGAGGHPAPFPIELPKRCVKLFSFVGNTVLDPFLGSGSTLIATQLFNRNGVGVEIDKKYCDIAIERLKKETNLT